MLRFVHIFIAVTLMALLVMPAANADRDTLKPFAAPMLAQGTWLNGKLVDISHQKGKVVVLLFWTRGCINCKHNLGYWNSWAKQYQGTDVTVVSVHTPEIPEDRPISAIKQAIRHYHLIFPVVTDNQESTWNSYGVQAWPTEILIDKRGTVRYQFEGELNWQGAGEYKTVEGLIEKLRMEKA